MVKRKMPLLLVRHGQAEHHIRSITGGWSDTTLTEKGRKQSVNLALRLGRELNGSSVGLGTSVLQRAVQTAAIIGETLDLEPHIYPALADLNNGLAAGKTHIEAQNLALPPSEPILDWRPYPQAESWRDFYARMKNFLEEFSAAQEHPAILVTHAANIHVIVVWWLGLTPESRAQFEVAPASLSVLRQNRFGEPAVERLNDTAHLYENGMPYPIRL
jgi:probable phosphoglycerate mutase